MNLQELQSTVGLLKNRLYRFSLGILGHEAEAADVVQEVFIKLWNSTKETDNIENPEAWCITVTKNLSLDRLRSKYRKMEPLKAGFDLHDANSGPLQKVVEDDVFEKVNELINRLPEKQQEVVRLREMENLSYQEIAVILNLTLDQVKINIFRARQSLRQGLEQLNLTTTN